jgi:DNA-binding transcriptional LysR family regulator
VQIDLRLSDQNEDLLKENIDLAVRIGGVKNQGLVAIPLGLSERRVFAAPAYLARHGTPRNPAELKAHNCIGFTLLEHYDIWNFTRDGQPFDVPIKGNITSNSSEGVREIVLSGQGLALSPDWLFAADVQNGAVTTVLDDYQTIALPVNAVLNPERRRSARTMAFVRFLQETR